MVCSMDPAMKMDAQSDWYFIAGNKVEPQTILLLFFVCMLKYMPSVHCVGPVYITCSCLYLMYVKICATAFHYCHIYVPNSVFLSSIVLFSYGWSYRVPSSHPCQLQDSWGQVSFWPYASPFTRVSLQSVHNYHKLRTYDTHDSGSK